MMAVTIEVLNSTEMVLTTKIFQRFSKTKIFQKPTVFSKLPPSFRPNLPGMQVPRKDDLTQKKRLFRTVKKGAIFVQLELQLVNET